MDKKKLQFNLNRDKEELQNTLWFLRDQIKQALASLHDKDFVGLNELGIFQGNASKADALAAKIRLQHRWLKEIEAGENNNESV